MDLISATERLANLGHKRITYNPGRCVLAIDKNLSCERCSEVCPVHAIQPGSPPSLRNAECAECLACLVVCPTEAFTAEDELNGLLTCLSRLAGGPVEILCAQNSHPELGISENATAIRLKHCLAGIGLGGFLAASALGIGPIIIRSEACQACRFNQLSSLVDRLVAQANGILKAINYPATVQSASWDALVARPAVKVWDAHNPPISRRELFRMIGSGGKVALVRSLALENQGEQRQPGLNHRRTVAAIRRLLDDHSPTSRIPADSPFASIRVSSVCTACGTCVRSCPNNAFELAFDQTEQQYLLAIRPADCNGCEVCAHVCAPQAIEINHSPAFQEIFSTKAFRILAKGSLHRCQRCGQLFAPEKGSALCQICEYRRNNPFSACLPPHLRSN